MRDGARGANLWREDEVRTQERHRHVREIEIELDAPADEERACQEFSELSETVRQVDCRQAPDDGCCYENVQHCPCSSRYPTVSWPRAFFGCAGRESPAAPPGRDFPRPSPRPGTGPPRTY